jgi:hypothetical protein
MKRTVLRGWIFKDRIKQGAATVNELDTFAEETDRKKGAEK